MSTRPEILFPLFAELNTLSGVGDKSAKAFAGLKITKPHDLIFTLPHSVVDRRVVQSVQGLAAPQTLSVRVRVVKHVSGPRPWQAISHHRGGCAKHH